MKVPVVLFIYKRLWSTTKVVDAIKSYSPTRLYIVADGPKDECESYLCKQVRDITENAVTWDCELVKLYSDKNLGCAKRVETGLNHIFDKEEMAIILEDDTLPNSSFFEYCTQLLLLYRFDDRIYHISGCNLYQRKSKSNFSYYFSSIVNIWGWATWKRCWHTYDINMSNWQETKKDKFLKKWCSAENITGTKEMFDLHCNNNDPWTWDYQWTFNCWYNDGLAVTPKYNLVSNIGIGPDATHTTNKNLIPAFPKIIEEMTFPLIHPEVNRNFDLETDYFNKSKPSIYRQLKNKIKNYLDDV